MIRSVKRTRSITASSSRRVSHNGDSTTPAPLAVWLLLIVALWSTSCRTPDSADAPARQTTPVEAEGAAHSEPSVVAGELRLPDGYAGSGSCRPCHEELHSTWSRSTHALHMALPSRERIHGDFERANEYEFHGTRSRMRREGEHFLMDYTGPDGEAGTYSVDYVLGVDQHEIYLHREPDGRLQVLPTHWNLKEGAWRDTREGVVHVGPVPLPRTDRNYWRSFGRTYNRACMECHSSQPRKGFDPQTLRYDSSFDPSINCEACHGPALQHVKLQTQQQALEPAQRGVDSTLIPLGSLSQRRSIEICASCHGRKRIYREGFVPGRAAADYFVPDVWERGITGVDGRSIGSNIYNWVETMHSPCIRRSTSRLDCAGSCHPPHAPRRDAPPGLAESNAQCTRCHVRHGAALTEHTFHAADSEGSRCIECHMPLIDYEGLWLRDHSMSSPLPELTISYGLPNACNDCHEYDPPQWAQQHMEAWYGQSPTFQRYRAEKLKMARVLNQVFQGEQLPVRDLIDWLDDTSLSVVQRASAAKFLGDAHDHEGAFQALLRHRREDDDVLRYYVIGGLGGFPRATDALREALTDRRLTVRVHAYEGLLFLDPAVEQDSSPTVAAVRAEYRRRLKLLADDPRHLSGLALLKLGRGNPQEAERLLRKGVALTKPVPELRRDLVQLLLHQGRLPEAAVEVAELQRIAPRTIEAGLTLAQLLLAQGRPADALQTLTKLQGEGHDSPALQQLRQIATVRTTLRTFSPPPSASPPGSAPGPR